jgi:hypothetical protein
MKAVFKNAGRLDKHQSALKGKAAKTAGQPHWRALSCGSSVEHAGQWGMSKFAGAADGSTGNGIWEFATAWQSITVGAAMAG